MLNRLSALLTSSSHRRDGAAAHMTFGQTSIGRTVSRTGLLLKRQLWIWPIVAVAVLAVIGYALNRSIHDTMESMLRSELETLLSVERSMLEKWLKVQESSAVALANSQPVRATVAELLAAQDESLETGVATDAPTTTAERERKLAELNLRLAKIVEPAMSSHDFVGFIVADKRQRIVAATAREMIGLIEPQYEAFLTRALESRPTVSPPFPSTILLKDSAGRLRSGTPTMFVAAPVLDDNLQVIAALALRIRPEKEFTSILQLGRFGESGETYAIDKNGLMLSNSRFDDQLMLLGLLPDEDLAASIVHLQVRDPGGDMATGFRPSVRRSKLPLTHAAAAATAGASGVDMDGYRDYRGSNVVGAWTWLPAYQMGVVTEIDVAEAYRPLTILKWTFFSLFALLGLSAAAIFVFTVIVARLQRQAQKAAIEAKHLGQYRLLEKVGEGAMGVVYKGQHAMLRRPTAIKMLNVDRVSEAAIGRFEREVQITCNLNNPHTVAIYDYGRTPEGVFYYAMEYLDGVDLQRLVDGDGPQSEGRVAHILRQICASLYEAHSLGLVHRDIKPANIMLNRRGGEPDVVKVLDFGLGKQLDDKREASGEMSGTPLYMSPEAIQTPDLVDPRSDLYAVGAVGYFLLTGQTAFDAQTLSELCQQHVSAIPAPPSERLRHPVSPELEHAILACLEKNRAKRPQTARDLAALLERVEAKWTVDEAEAWWSRHERGQTQLRGGNGMRDSRVGGNASASGGNGPAPSAHGAKPSAASLDRTTVFGVNEEE